MSDQTMQANKLKAYVKLVLIILWILFCIPLFCIFWLIPFLRHENILLIFHKNLCRIMGVKVIVHGQQSDYVPTLYVSNHVSYLDIPVLGGIIKAFFVAKSEIASWPVINHLCRFQNTIFIERRASKSKQQAQLLRKYLKSKKSLIFFPEGTSTNGAEVLSLKSSLFAAVEPEKGVNEPIDVLIQPVAIVYSKYKNQGMNQAKRDYYAWYADFPFGSHVMNMLALGNVTAEVSFCRPVKLSDFLNRKDCAFACGSAMRDAFNQVFAESGSQN